VKGTPDYDLPPIEDPVGPVSVEHVAQWLRRAGRVKVPVGQSSRIFAHMVYDPMKWRYVAGRRSMIFSRAFLEAQGIDTVAMMNTYKSKHAAAKSGRTPYRARRPGRGR
jgi:hypothetical protein